MSESNKKWAPAPIAMLDKFVALSILIGVATFIGAWAIQVHIAISFDSFWDGTYKFGDDCEFFSGNAPNKDFAAAFNQQKITLPILAPFRRNDKTPTTTDNDGYLYLKCRVDLTNSKENARPYYYMNLGRLYGDSAILINGKLRLLTYDNSIAQIPLVPEDLQKQTILEIVSFAEPNNASTGPATLLPFFAANSDEQIQKALLVDWFYKLQRPTFFFGYSLGLFVFFSTVWICGLRYRDISWMTIQSALISALWYLSYSPVGHWKPWQELSASILRYSIFAAAFGLLYSFFRSKPRGVRIEVLVLSFLLIVIAFRFIFPQSLWLELSMRSYIPGFVACLAYAIPGVHGLLNRKYVTGKRKTRVLIVATLAIVSAPMFAIQAWLVRKTGISVEPFLIFSILTIMAIFVVEDLVRFLQNHRKIVDPEQKSPQTTSISKISQLAKGILPPELSNCSTYLEYSWELTPSQFPRDWTQIHACGESTIFFLGSVIANDDRAPFAISMICATIGNEFRKVSTINDNAIEICVEKIDAMLNAHFYGEVKSSMDIVAVYKNQFAKVYNNGGPKVVVSEGKVALRLKGEGTVAGTNNFLTHVQTIQLKPGTLLALHTEGFLDGAKNTGRFAQDLPTYPNNSHSEIIRASRKIQPTTTESDDSTILLITIK